MKLYLLLACVSLIACSGGGGGAGGTLSSVLGGNSGNAGAASGSSSTGTGSGGDVVALDPNNPGNYAIHYVIEDGSGRRGLNIVPVGSSEDASLQPSPAPGVVITYPDGSQQTADANGTFNPATSSYVLANVATLQTNPNAAPFAIITDPSGRALPLYTQFDTSGNASALSGTGASSTARSPQDASANAALALASVTLQPASANAFAGSLVPFGVVGLDSSGLVNKLAGAVVSWRAAAGSVLPIAGSARVLYRAPASGNGSDVITATVVLPGDPVSYTATATVAYVDGSGSYAVNGVISAGSPGSTPLAAAFLQSQNTGSVLGSTYWFAQVNQSNGAFSINLPKNANFTPLAQSAASSLMSLSGPGNATTFGTQAAPTGTVAFSVPSVGPTFVLPTPAPLPPVASFIDDAWNAGGLALVHHLFDADSGLNDSPAPILYNELPMSSPGTIADGFFAGWRYQWTAKSGALTLTLVEASGTTPGTHSATIVPTSTGFSYVRYVGSTPLSLASPLVAQQSGVALDSTGTWTQAGSASTLFTANVTMQLYSASRQTLGSPQYTETLVYNRDGGGNVTFTPDTLYDSSGRALWSLTATRTPTNTLNYGTVLAVYSYSGSLTRDYYLANGGQSSAPFTLSGTANGDGSGHASYSAPQGGLSVVYDLVAPSQSASLRAQNGIVTSQNTLPPQIATFTITSNGVVNATLFANAITGFAGNPLSFSL